MVSSRVGSCAATTPRATHAIMQRGLRSFGPGRRSGAEALPHGALESYLGSRLGKANKRNCTGAETAAGSAAGEGSRRQRVVRLPPREFGSVRRAETQHKPSRGERGFFLSTARCAAPRGVVGVLGAGFGGRFLKSNPRESQELAACERPRRTPRVALITATIAASMWPLSASAAEEVAATVVSIDVPADYKWVLLALVGSQPA